MLVIANAYRRLNLWSANCGASFEWVGRAIDPYLGFLTGWLMIAASLIAAVAGVVVLAPSVLAIFGGSVLSTWPNIFISTAVIVVLLVIAVAGIRLTARTQVAMGVIEYVILIGFSIWGLVVALGHHHGTFPISGDWFSDRYRSDRWFKIRYVYQGRRRSGYVHSSEVIGQAATPRCRNS